MNLLDFAAGTAAGLLPAVAWTLLKPSLDFWLDAPRESRTERRNRRVRTQLDLAQCLLDEYPELARRRLRRILRASPHHATAWTALGNAEQMLENHEQALHYFRRALAAATRGPFVPESMPDGQISELAMAAARSTAILRLELTTSDERQRLGREILEWVDLAIQDDAATATELLERIPVGDLHAEFQRLLVTHQHPTQAQVSR